jgi:hypothetical protein
MSLRLPYDKSAIDTMNERGDKLLGRAYLLWLFGVGAGLIKLKANKFSFSGVEYSIDNSEVIQGLLFVACVLCYVAMGALFTLYTMQWSVFSRGVHRKCLYLASGPTFTLRGRNLQNLRVMRRSARLKYFKYLLVGLAITGLPLAYIALFERAALWIVVKAMLQ